MPAPTLRRCAVFAAKAEATPGTPETLTAAEGKFNVYNVEVTENTEFNARPGQGGFSPIAGVLGARTGTMTFNSELHGNGGSGVPAWFSVFMPACGFTVAGSTATPISCNPTPTMLTLGHFRDGSRLLRLSGAQGTSVWTFRSGRIVEQQWEFRGGYVLPSTETRIAPDYPSVIPPRFADAILTIGGDSFPITECVMTMNNELVYRPDATAASGINGTVITDRRVTFSFDPEAFAYATKNWDADWLASTQLALVLTVGGAANNTISITAPKLQLAEAPNMGDREGLATDKLVFQANRNADAGDDEVSIVLS